MPTSHSSGSPTATTSLDGKAPSSPEALFEPFTLKALHLTNRVVMAPMTRCFSPHGVPTTDVAAYYARRAAAGVGLIISEGTYVPHVGASNDPDCPHFFGEAALRGWAEVLAAVHAAGSRMFPQLWHVGLMLKPELENLYAKAGVFESQQVGPSGIAGGMGHPIRQVTKPMTEKEIEACIGAFATAAQTAFDMGFDGIEIHGAHGYLIDQFFWETTNCRDDEFGGSIERRTRFACEIIRESRRRTSRDFPIALRISQWKGQDYEARLARTPQELATFLEPLVEAGVDLFDCSTRRFWEPEFAGSELNLAGWAKKLTGRSSMTVGSVSLDKELIESLYGAVASPTSIDKLLRMLERGDFDLVAVGRALLADPEWAVKVRRNDFAALRSYSPEELKVLQ